MKAIDLQDLIGAPLDLAFALAGDLVRDCVFTKTLSNAGTGLLEVTALDAPVTALFVDYHSQDIDGSAVLLGDEKAFIRSGELSGVAAPAEGDVLVETRSGLRRLVVAARQNLTGTFWVLQVRRSMTEDCGDLTAAGVGEDWGDLGAATLFDDWQA